MAYVLFAKLHRTVIWFLNIFICSNNLILDS